MPRRTMQKQHMYFAIGPFYTEVNPSRNISCCSIPLQMPRQTMQKKYKYFAIGSLLYQRSQPTTYNEYNSPIRKQCCKKTPLKICFSIPAFPNAIANKAYTINMLCDWRTLTSLQQQRNGNIYTKFIQSR